MSAQDESTRAGATAAEHLEAQRVMLAALEPDLGALSAVRVSVGEGVHVEPDGVNEDRSAFVEVYARHGKLVGGQRKKIAQDILKFSMLRAQHPNARLVLAFASQQARDSITGWLALAAETHGIELIVVPVGDELAARIVSATDRMRKAMKDTAAERAAELVDQVDTSML